jgi:hypothetical protein
MILVEDVLIEIFRWSHFRMTNDLAPWAMSGRGLAYVAEFVGRSGSPYVHFLTPYLGDPLAVCFGDWVTVPAS